MNLCTYEGRKPNTWNFNLETISEINEYAIKIFYNKFIEASPIIELLSVFTMLQLLINIVQKTKRYKTIGYNSFYY